MRRRSSRIAFVARRYQLRSLLYLGLHGTSRPNADSTTGLMFCGTTDPRWLADALPGHLRSLTMLFNA